MKIKYLINYVLSFILFIKIIAFSSIAFSNELICKNKIIDTIISKDPRNIEYNELRNDSGIHFLYEWDKKNEEIIIKRNKNNLPIVRYSLFDDKNFLPNKTIIKKIDNKDLSKLNDIQLEKFTYLSGKVNFELENGRIINISSKPYKFNNYKLSNFEILSIQNIDTTKGILEMSFDSRFTNVRKDLTKVINENNLSSERKIEICRNARYYDDWPLQTVKFDEFKYDADVREGLKNKELLANPVFEIIIDDSIVRTLRTEKGVGFFRQSFDFRSFPFDKQKLIIRIKTGVGNYSDSNLEDNKKIGSLTLISPDTGVFLNLKKFLDPEVNKLKAWHIPENGITVSSKNLSENRYDIFTEKTEFVTENVLDIEIIIERNYAHYVWKIMLPVFLILCVAWYVLWIPTEKYEARLNTSIIALLALIAYNFVFQDDIPKLEYLTDMDRFILLSYIFCCIPVFLSIAFSKFISRNQKKVMKINRFIKIWGGVIYILLTAQIFYIV